MRYRILGVLSVDQIDITAGRDRTVCGEVAGRPVRYRILGPLWADGVEVTAHRDRIVLALLLVRVNRVVSVDELVDAVWDEDPPVTARGQLQTCVSRLRRALPAGVIRTDPAGYAVVAGPDDLDVLRFDRLVEAGELRAALDLWRGPALAGIDSPVIRRFAAGWDERYALTAEDWVNRELDAGRDRDLVAELSRLVEVFPLRERLRGQLMTVLARIGRRADALTEFRRIRTLLHRDLGIEIGRAHV